MFDFFYKLFSRSSSSSHQPPKKGRFVLVLSGGGMRGFYTLGILKAIEES
ncbi:MAG: hypothetical protein LBP53_05845 [Candidatus Peribacteria bacterium]|jgi:predicted acylesterase/phospholipase RssA|nr:hypothetical protein [Candidatus Peribacteria bacterium]